MGWRAIQGVPHRTKARCDRRGCLARSGPDGGAHDPGRAILGLPITFFFKSIFAELTGRGMDPREARRKASATVSPSRGLGRASPLFFRILPLAGTPTSYTVLMGLFRSQFLPDHEMTAKPADFSLRPARVDVPTDYSLIDRWFDHVTRQGVGLLSVPLR